MNKINGIKKDIRRIQQINEYIFEKSFTKNEDDDNKGQSKNQEDDFSDMGDDDKGTEQGESGGDGMNDMPNKNGFEGGPDSPDMNHEEEDGDNNDIVTSDDLEPEGGEDFEDDGFEDDDLGGDDFGGDDFGGVETDTMQDGDEVIDVDELTNKQEETSKKMDVVDDKLVDLTSVLQSFVEVLRNNDKKIEKLEQELVKRNPTDSERIGIRQRQSGPFSESPFDTMDRLNKRMDRDGLNSSQPENMYEITFDDINSGSFEDLKTTFNSVPSSLNGYFKV